MNTLEMVKKMTPSRREHWLEMAVNFGLACTCKAVENYCALHDMKLQELITDKRERMKKHELSAISGKD